MADEEEDQVEEITQEQFIHLINTVLDSMKETYRALERTGSTMRAWCEDRREYEEKEDSCGCVSEVFDDLGEMMAVVGHNLMTYGGSIAKAADVVITHDAEHERREKMAERMVRAVGEKVAEVISKQQAQEVSPKEGKRYDIN